MKIRKINDVIGMKVYTNSGEYFGEIEEANLSENKIDGWRIRVGGSVLSLIGGARGVKLGGDGTLRPSVLSGAAGGGWDLHAVCRHTVLTARGGGERDDGRIHAGRALGSRLASVAPAGSTAPDPRHAARPECALLGPGCACARSTSLTSYAQYTPWSIGMRTSTAVGLV